jgi:pimeloyl-ACP methyl ester carboxylesterase
MIWILLGAGAVLIAPLGFVAVRRRLVARRLALPSDGIDEHGYVRIGGVDQWVQIRGVDRANPVLLMLHAHGISMVPLTPLYRSWEKHFTVVQWDRRTVGRTRRAGRRAGQASWSFEQFIADGVELVEHLRQRLGQDQVILVAHSQGTVIGVGMIRRRPDLFRAYVGLGQMVDMPRNEAMAYDAVLRAARARGKAKVVDRLVALGRPPYPDPGAWIRRLRLAMAVDAEVAAWQKLLLTRMLFMPGYTPRDILHSLADVMLLPQRLYDETMAVTPATLGTRFQVPVLLLHGSADSYALPELASGYVDLIEAPAKAYVALNGLGHLAPFLAPDRVGRELVSRLVAQPAGSPGQCGTQPDHQGLLP